MRNHFFTRPDVLERLTRSMPHARARAPLPGGDRPLISIVMAHRNRPDLLAFTLQSIARSAYSNLEVVIVDDRSDPDMRPAFLDHSTFPFPVILHSIDDASATGVRNPAAVYNLGFAKAHGDIIVIQNPECVHIGDVLSYVGRRFSRGEYLSFPVYSSNSIAVNDYVLEHIDAITMRNVAATLDAINHDETYPEFPTWYQHPAISDRNLHFCTAISREDLDLLGGFDASYDQGACYDDDDLILRIREVLKLDIRSLSPDANVGAIHMYHGRNTSVNIPNYVGDDPGLLDVKRKYFMNQQRFEARRARHADQRICVPKVCHFYWDDSTTLSLLHVVTVLSFSDLNFGWTLILWMPANRVAEITWDEPSHKARPVHDDAERLFRYVTRHIPNLVVKRVHMDEIGFDDRASEVHKADYLRYHALHRYGGVWSDLDIVFLKPLSAVFDGEFDNVIYACASAATEYRPSGNYVLNYRYFPIALFLAKRGSALFKRLLDRCPGAFDRKAYQCLGADLLGALFSSMDDHEIAALDGERTLVLGNEYYLPYQWYETGLLFDPEYADHRSRITDKTVGVHWFNGHPAAEAHLRDRYAAGVGGGDAAPAAACYLDTLIRGYAERINEAVAEDEARAGAEPCAAGRVTP